MTREETPDYRGLSSGAEYPSPGGYPGLNRYRGEAPDMAEPYPEALGGLGSPQPDPRPAPFTPAASDYPFDLPPRATASKYGTAPATIAGTDPPRPAEESSGRDPAEDSSYDLSSASYRPQDLYPSDTSGDEEGAGVSFAQGATYRLDPPVPSGPEGSWHGADTPSAREPRTPPRTVPASETGHGHGTDSVFADPPLAPKERGADGAVPEELSADASKAPPGPGHGAGPAEGDRPYGGGPDGPAAEATAAAHHTGLGASHPPPPTGPGGAAADQEVDPSRSEGPQPQDPLSVYRIPTGSGPAAPYSADRLVPPYRQSDSSGRDDDTAVRPAAGPSRDLPSGGGDENGYDVPDPPVIGGGTGAQDPTASGLGGSLGTGSGDTWAFSRDDPRLPDSVRESAERAALRRAGEPDDPLAPYGENPADPERTGEVGGDEWDRSAEPAETGSEDDWPQRDQVPAEPSVEDPLLAVAAEQARVHEPGHDRDWADDRGRSGGIPDPGESTRAMPVIESEQDGPGPAEPGPNGGPPPTRSGGAHVGGYDELGYPVGSDRTETLGLGDGAGYGQWAPRGTGPGYDELGYDDRDAVERRDGSGYADGAGWSGASGESGYDELGYDDRAERGRGTGLGDGAGYSQWAPRGTGPGYDELGYNDRPVHEDSSATPDGDSAGHGGFGAPRAEPEEASTPRREAFAPGDGHGGSGYEDGALGSGAEGAWEGDTGLRDEADRGAGRDDHDDFDDYDDDVDDRYYPEPLAQERGRSKKRDKISEEFPGFSGPLGGEPDSDYPGYDNIEVWPETEGLATATVWLGVLSLVPGIGLLFAAAALILGPRAKRNIRDSRGELEGEQLAKGGTTLAYVGIAVSVVTLVGYFLLG